MARSGAAALALTDENPRWTSHILANTLPPHGTVREEAFGLDHLDGVGLGTGVVDVAGHADVGDERESVFLAHRPEAIPGRIVVLEDVVRSSEGRKVDPLEAVVVGPAEFVDGRVDVPDGEVGQPNTPVARPRTEVGDPGCTSSTRRRRAPWPLAGRRGNRLPKGSGSKFSLAWKITLAAAPS